MTAAQSSDTSHGATDTTVSGAAHRNVFLESSVLLLSGSQDCGQDAAAAEAPDAVAAFAAAAASTAPEWTLSHVMAKDGTSEQEQRSATPLAMEQISHAGATCDVVSAAVAEDDMDETAAVEDAPDTDATQGTVVVEMDVDMPAGLPAMEAAQARQRRTFVCPECGYVGSRRENFIRHAATHLPTQDRTTFRCMAFGPHHVCAGFVTNCRCGNRGCTKTFTLQSNMLRHAATCKVAK